MAGGNALEFNSWRNILAIRTSDRTERSCSTWTPMFIVRYVVVAFWSPYRVLFDSSYDAHSSKARPLVTGAL
jgi:hypothetical protein